MDLSLLALAFVAGNVATVNPCGFAMPCLAELPRVEQAYQTHQDEVDFLGLDLQDSEQAAAWVIRDTGVSYPIGVDPRGRLFQAVGGIGMPTTLFVAADGTVLERFAGELSAEQLVDRLATYGMIDCDWSLPRRR